MHHYKRILYHTLNNVIKVIAQCAVCTDMRIAEAFQIFKLSQYGVRWAHDVRGTSVMRRPKRSVEARFQRDYEERRKA